MAEEKKYTTVSIPIQLHQKIEEKIRGTGFNSVSSYVTYILRQLISESKSEEGEAFTKEDEEKIKERLRSLGYI